MKYVIKLFAKALRNIGDTELIESERERKYIIHFATSLKNARKNINVIDYSVNKDEQGS